VSLAFYNQNDADFYDPGAPSIIDRMNGVQQLCRNSISCVLRIDPLLPRNPLPQNKTLEEFQLSDAQSLDRLEKLVRFAKDNNMQHIVYSVAKIIAPRYKSITSAMQRLKEAYQHIAQPDKLVFRGGSWRLPDNAARKYIVKPFLEICKRHNVKACFCKQNLLQTP
jgi:DNA repair photolyase